MKKAIILFLLLSFGLSQSKVSIQDKEIEINENEAVMEVLGMVCSMCAFGIGEGFSKTDFIDKSKFSDGVSVDIDAQYVQLGLLESVNINPEKIVQVIQDAGYDVSLLFILKNDKLTKFGTDKLGILQPIAFNLTSDRSN
tara:strand:- start:1806 stop:2225 length:420 start_codon:yes stop_codon:yes gene_type:complete